MITFINILLLELALILGIVSSFTFSAYLCGYYIGLIFDFLRGDVPKGYRVKVFIPFYYLIKPW